MIRSLNKDKTSDHGNISIMLKICDIASVEQLSIILKNCTN